MKAAPACRHPGGPADPSEIGRRVSFSGPVIDNPRDGRYGCDTETVLIADFFYGRSGTPRLVIPAKAGIPLLLLSCGSEPSQEA